MRRLTGLSGNNRSLVLLRLTSEQFLDVQQLSQLKGEPAFEIIKAFIAGKDKKICALLDSRMEAANEASKRLKRLQRLDKFIYEERGSNDLHIGWPVVRGKLADGTLIRAPLLFFPARLVQDKTDWVLQVRKEAGITFNKSFLLAYYYYNQVKPDETLLEFDFEELDTDSTVFRTQLYQLLKERLELNFNPDTFTDQLIPFQEFRKDEFDEQHRVGEIKLFHEAVLGIFPQAGSQLVPDYLQLIEEHKFETLEDLFASKNYSDGREIKNESVAINLAVQEEKVHAPFPLDSWQEHALKLSKLGRSLVVQGPPGTGKSQLICNLIADGIASGKRVLVVCQKRAALDVVYDRLRQIDLADFLGLVHDFRNDRKSIYQKIARQIDRVEEYKMLNRGIDAIQTERRFVHVSRNIDRLVEELEEFRMALFHDQECGLSVKELYLTSNPAQDSVNIKQEYQYFQFTSLDDFIRRMSRYVRYAQQFETETYSWRDRKSLAAFTLSDKKELERTVLSVPNYQEKLGAQLHELVGVNLNLEECESLLQRREDVNDMVNLLADEGVYRFFIAMVDEKDEETSLLWLQNIERLVLNCFDKHGVETTLKADQIGQCQVALQKRIEARRNWIKLIRWELFSEHKFFLKRVVIGNGLTYTKKGLRTLEARIDNRLNLEHHLTALRDKVWLVDYPGDFNDKGIRKWFEKQKYAVRAKLLFSSLREIRNGIVPSHHNRDEFIRLIWSVFDLLQPLRAKKADWQKYLSNYQLRQLIQHPEVGGEMIQVLQRDFDQLSDYDRLKEGFLSHEKEVIGKLRERLDHWEAGAFEELFQNSLRLAWIDHIETKYPVLTAVSTLRMAEMEEELQRDVEIKLELSKEILLLRARECICESIEYNRLNNRVTYRDLHHQVTKKKRVWPVRKLVTEFAHEVFNLVPCWMASPESVSAIFPMEEMFDLVIFDEASQCFSERGLPAVCRGKQVVVAGDDKQLRPFELYQARWEEDSDIMELEVDSLLELCSKYLETVHLQGHYRSKAIELIDFSNRHFYSGELRVLPDKKISDLRQPAIEYHKIDGMWENQTNPLEAEEVARKVLDLIREFPDKEIGVVTFNMPQQMLIMDMLESEAATSGLTLPSSSFVKNIENVQGDEKDIIIFSIGYAPDKKGKLNMQFGSLNVVGGENRLNVAVTRARERVIIVSSLWPEALRIDDSKNEGPKLLRHYLEYAREVAAGNFSPAVLSTKPQNPAWYLQHHMVQWSEQTPTSLSFVPQLLPFADVVLNRDKKHEGIILTDDSLYFRALTAKEPHVYTPQLLALKNWTYLRVFSRNWWTDREKVLHEVAKYMYQLNESQ
jgi:DNA polymerase IIIc chi subunit